MQIWCLPPVALEFPVATCLLRLCLGWTALKGFPPLEGQNIAGSIMQLGDQRHQSGALSSQEPCLEPAFPQ